MIFIPLDSSSTIVVSKVVEFDREKVEVTTAAKDGDNGLKERERKEENESERVFTYFHTCI